VLLLEEGLGTTVNGFVGIGAIGWTVFLLEEGLGTTVDGFVGLGATGWTMFLLEEGLGTTVDGFVGLGATGWTGFFVVSDLRFGFGAIGIVGPIITIFPFPITTFFCPK
jgi:hypothetical protein